MSSCYRTGNKNKDKSTIDDIKKRKKRFTKSNKNKTSNNQNFCKNYVKEQHTEPCRVIIHSLI